MPTVIVTHKVKDKAHWLASSNRQAFFGPLGVTNIRTFVNPDDPTQVALIMDVADLGAVLAALQTPAAAAAMDDDGVLPETLSLHIEA